MKFLPIFVSIILTVFYATTTSIYVYAENEEYYDDEYNFSIQHPENWKLIDISNDDEEYPDKALWIYANIVDDGYSLPTNMKESNSLIILYIPALLIEVFPNTTDNKKIAEQEKQENQDLEDSIQYNLGPRYTWNLAEVDDKKFGKKYVITVFKENRSVESTYITNGKYVFKIIYSTPPKYFDIYKDRFHKIINSIEFKN